MLQATHLIGFGVGRSSAAGRTLGSLISPSGLTKIGSMTLGGGLAAAFDGTTNQAGPACADNAANGWVGETFASTKRIFQCITYGINNGGYDGAGYSGSVTLTLYAKTGAAPSTYSDGTSLGSTTLTNSSATLQRTITSSDTETLWAHAWLYISGPTFPRLAELEVYEAV